MARKPVSASLRWQVFARDNFTCRYCGSQAGQNGVTLHADHIISVADGGDGSFDNLITACARCNGGKGARSLKAVPSSEAMADEMKKRAASIRAQVKSVHSAIEASKRVQQAIVNIKCSAYGTERIKLARGEVRVVQNLAAEFGVPRVHEFYQIACDNGVKDYDAVRYVCGIARKIRKDAVNALD